MAKKNVLGIDIGGSGIKGALVNLKKGEFATDRLRIETPSVSTPENVAKVVKQIVDNFSDELKDGPVGITIPAVVQHGVTMTAANIDKSWIGAPAEKIFEDALGRDVVVVNDADAAGIAEVKYGAAQDHPGLVLLTTLGTGIGTALINNGVLVPNIEMGHIEVNGSDVEPWASAAAREREKLNYEVWSKRLQKYYSSVEFLLNPDLIVVGGGVSKNSDKFLPLISTRAPIVPAKLRNAAGIVGAAWLAADRVKHPDVLSEAKKS